MPFGLLVKDGVRFDRIARAGARILGALDTVARTFGRDLTITCACEGHPPTDPHTLGEAYDVRTHDMLNEEVKLRILSSVMELLCEPGESTFHIAGGIASTHFWGWLEHPGTDAEHLHIQRRRGTAY